MTAIMEKIESAETTNIPTDKTELNVSTGVSNLYYISDNFLGKFLTT